MRRTAAIATAAIAAALTATPESAAAVAAAAAATTSLAAASLATAAVATATIAAAAVAPPFESSRHPPQLALYLMAESASPATRPLRNAHGGGSSCSKYGHCSSLRLTSHVH